jgi:hypothetical protein
MSDTSIVNIKVQEFFRILSQIDCHLSHYYIFNSKWANVEDFLKGKKDMRV